MRFRKWRRNKKDWFMEDWRTLAQALVRRKLITICTVGNPLSSLICRAFSDSKHVVIICDEASLCTDSAPKTVVVDFSSDRIDADSNRNQSRGRPHFPSTNLKSLAPIVLAPWAASIVRLFFSNTSEQSVQCRLANFSSSHTQRLCRHRTRTGTTFPALASTT